MLLQPAGGWMSKVKVGALVCTVFAFPVRALSPKFHVQSPRQPISPPVGNQQNASCTVYTNTSPANAALYPIPVDCTALSCAPLHLRKRRAFS
ncbi:hypothetical protein IAQ61_006840 [Plenodomus lingam]|uniref:uncharacterized protein n=1 Tax=Leptosphaeria maculans TaxID=5022 RepID=UPI0033191E67|nr:hypothetical protein IAQ61_006840 [Plenodomus lingam]